MKSKSKSTAYLLFFLGGFFGLHRFYIGKIGTGILWMFTGGVMFIGLFMDLFTLGSQVEQYNTKVELKTIRANALKKTQSK